MPNMTFSQAGQMLDAALLGLLVLDDHGQIAYANDMLASTFGYSRDQLLGMPIEQLIPERHREHHPKLRDSYVQSDFNLGGHGRDLQGRRQDGTVFTVEVRLTSIMDQGVRSAAAIVIDTTQRKQIEHERDQLLFEEKAARSQAENIQRRQSFLAQASRAITSSLDYHKTLTAFIQATVPFLGDACMIDLLQEGQLSRIAATHTNPTKHHLIQNPWQGTPSTLSSQHPLLQELAAGRALFLPQLDEEHLHNTAFNGHHMRLIRQIGVTSLIVVPISIGSQLIGAMSLLISESERQFCEDDLQTARDLATLAAQALENARLFHEAQEAMRRKDEALALLESTVASAPFGFAFLDTSFRYQMINQWLADMGNRPIAEHIGHTPDEVIPKISARIAPLLQQVCETKQPIINREIITLPTDTQQQQRNLVLNYYPVLTKDQELLGIGFLMVDITQTKQAEQALARYQILAEHGKDIVLFLRPDGMIIEANRAATLAYGYDPATLATLAFRQLQSDEDLTDITTNQNMALIEGSHRRSDGSAFPVEITILHSTIDREPVIACVIRDISERKRAEEERQSREAQFRMLADNAHDIIYRYQYHEPIGFNYVSPSVTRILGYTPEEHYADPTLGERIIHPEDLPMVLQHRPQTHDSRPIVFRWVCKDGSIRWAEQYITPIYDAQGQLFAIEGIARDITERKQAEEERGQFAAMVNSSEDAIFSVDFDTIITSWNRGAEQITGYTAEEALGQTPLFLILPEQQDARRAFYKQLQQQQEVIHNETIWCRKDGRKLDVNITISPIRLRDHTVGLSFIARDITERKQAEQSIRRQASLNKLLQVIAAAANQARSLEMALQSAVDHICEILGWPLGHVYLATETGFFALTSSNIWYVSEPQEFAAFRSITELNKVALIDDLPGKVLLSGKVEWASDLGAVEDTLRTRLISASGIRSGFAFPVLVGAETVAVLEFFSKQPMEPDEQLTEVFEFVGAQLGRVAERIRAETAIRASEERYRLIADHTADLITLLDAQGRMIYASPSYHSMLGHHPPALLGQSIYALLHPDDAERASLAWSDQASGAGSQITVRMASAAGEWRFIAMRGMRTLQRDQRYLVCIGHDVSEQLRSEEALRSAEARYRTLVEQQPAIIYTIPIEPHSFSKYISPQIETILGFSADAWLRDPGLWDRQVHPDDRGLVHQIAHQGTPHSQTHTTEYRIFAHDGRLVWMQDIAKIVLDHHGQPLFVQGIAFDITDRKQAENALRRSEQLYRALAHNFPNGSVFLFDHDLNITIADGTDLGRFGLSSELLEGKNLKGSISQYLYDEIETLCEQTLTGELISREFEIGGYTYRAHMLPVRNEHGQIMAGMIMSQDITDYKEATKALAEERTLLARRVEERTADLSAANAELARASRLKDEFLANMSHELRTPLNAVLGLSEALREHAYGPLNEQQERSLQTIEDSGRHLLELINDILDLAKVGAGKMDIFLEPTNVEMICQASTRMIRQIAQKKHLTIKTSIEPQARQIMADPRRLKQILVNLISNAVKFTPAGGQIGLEVQADANQQAVHFTVWDTGIGIANDQLEHLFQPFVQLDSSLTRHYEGTGLGLALVYRMTELHGGSVSASSVQGEGSSFRISIPWQPVEQASDATAKPPQSAPGSVTFRRTLIIEDSQTSAEHIVRYLSEYQIESTITSLGAQACALALSFQPDLILLDLLLPDISGWEVLAQLKANPKTRDIPVVIISVVDDQRRASELGAVAHMTKPYTRATLRHVLQTISLGGQRGRFIHSPHEQPPTILLAEDNEANILTMVDYLENAGYHVVIARNGAEAIAQAREVRPGIILMDIQMPGMDGIEATKRLRADPQLAAIPIIAMTALAMPGDRERCLEAGASDYMSKPISLRQLTDTISALI
ncbi:PAS domain S-box protein [Chloroflexia bacterium SDU3-3]|nr:PAS domain S-box protein [Chloroflexia bacterium SDU3-3]